MVFEGDSLKDYRLDFKDDKLVKVELPNVEERKVGKWIETTIGINDGNLNRGFKCSCCGLELTFNDYHFCPCCGAEMRGAENE